MNTETAGDRLMTQQLTSKLPLPIDIIQLILNLVQELNHRLLGYPRSYVRRNDLAYVRRNALPKFSQLFKISLHSYTPQYHRPDWRRLERRVSDPTASFVENYPSYDKVYPLMRKIFTPIGTIYTESYEEKNRQYLGPGF